MWRASLIIDRNWPTTTIEFFNVIFLFFIYSLSIIFHFHLIVCSNNDDDIIYFCIRDPFSSFISFHFLRLLTIDDYGVFSFFLFFVESVALKKLDNNTCLDMDDIFSFLFFDSTFLHLFSLTISSSISREKW